MINMAAWRKRKQCYLPVRYLLGTEDTRVTERYNGNLGEGHI